MKDLLAFNIGEALELKPGVTIGGRYPALSSLGTLITTLLPNIFVLAGVIMFVLLIGGGLTVIINAGGDNPQNVAKGQKAISAAIVGFLVIFCSYWIVQIIQYITGVTILR